VRRLWANYWQITILTIYVAMYSTVAFGQSKPIVSDTDIGNGVGEFRFELHQIGLGTYQRWEEIPAEI